MEKGDRAITVMFHDLNKERIVFHFNKAFLDNPNIPMWVIKYKGQTWYVDHVKSDIGFSTKETPDNEHTKGSVMFKGSLLIVIDNDKTIAYIK